VAFKDIDVSVDKDGLQTMIQKSGQIGVPVIDVDDTVIVGFNRNKLEELL
jgi:glutaredoxin 3